MHAVSMDMSLVGEGILSEMAVLVRDKAKGAIGTYRYGWPKLGPAAIANERFRYQRFGRFNR